MIHPNTRNQITRTTRLSAFVLAVAAIALALVVVAPARANAQAREMLNRLVQATGGNDPAMRALDHGREFIDSQKWEQAASAFDSFLAKYPSDKSVDTALFWLAYAHNKQGNYQAASDTLARLFKEYPRSTWIDDAKTLRAQVLSSLDPNYRPEVKAEDNDDLIIIALKALCENDRVGCSARVSEVLKSSTKSARVKEAAMILLGRYGGNEAVPALIQLSRSEPNEKLRMRAIRVLGNTNDDRALDVLHEIAMSATYEDESPTDSAIHALAGHDSPRAVSLLGDLALNGKHPRVRTHAVELLSRRKGDNVVDELFRIYDASSEVQVKKYVLAGLSNRRDPRAINKLVEVARSAPDVQLRAQAIRAIPNRGEEQDLDVLLPLYDSERDNDLKNNLLQAIGQYQNKRAYHKLMDVVRNTAEPIERRKTAIQMLSRSKDPEVLAFLEGLLK
jgi:HEAT repeat protein